MNNYVENLNIKKNKYSGKKHLYMPSLELKNFL